MALNFFFANARRCASRLRATATPCWLAPRLGRFLDQNPGVTINLVTRLSSFDFRLDSIDAAIHFGHPHWPGAELTFLMSEKTVAACSPAFLRQHGSPKLKTCWIFPYCI
ncbi:hypothetical protein AJ87_34060 [Rhizobium yanglingense]|nr:hypothetical protein AJ87_34060 [Rhizobium yanglingense]